MPSVYDCLMNLSWHQRVIEDSRFEIDDPDEELGTKPKRWIKYSRGERLWLVKNVRIDANDGTIAGEDWAEWLAMVLARLLSVPCAVVEPVLYKGKRAIASQQVFEPGAGDLAHGNELLSNSDSMYDSKLRKSHPGYTVQAVSDVLSELAPPIDWPELAGFSGFDVWAGFVVLDALMQGTDRHHENWAVVSSGHNLYLAPSYDHGNAFGFQLRDDERNRRLQSEEAFNLWINRGKSKPFSGSPSPLEVAFQALKLASSKSRQYWFKNVTNLRISDFESSLESIPEAIMSEVAHKFAYKILVKNRGRFIDEYSRRFQS